MKISKRDWSQLSAYVDGELSQRDSIKLEARMEGNPDFQVALEDLRTVKSVLSQAPRLAVPRNFTLRRSQVESPQKRAVPVRGYRLATAVLSFLFIGVLVLDFGSGVLKGGLSASIAPREEEVMLEAAADEMEEPALMMAKEAGEVEMAPEAEMVEAPAATENLGTGLEGESVPMAEEADRAADAEGEYFGEESLENENLLSQEEDTQSEEAGTPPEQEIDRTDRVHPIPWLRILEVVFGMGAVGFGVAALEKRRKDRKP